MSPSIRIRSTLSVAIAASLLLGLGACGNNNAPPAGNGTASRPAATASAAKKPVAVPAAASTSAQAQAQAARARIGAMSVKQLLAAGNTAINQQKLVAPQGDNAFEYYEKALEKDSSNQAAQDALREQFPFGANAVEQAIGQNDFDEAQREIGLLSKADPGNYTLKILNSKLDTAKKQQQRLADQKAKQAAELAARQAAAAKAASTPPPAPPPEQKQVVQQAPPAQVVPAPVQQAPKAPPPEPKPAGETRVAQVVSPAAPEYPLQAARNNQSGYVTVGFTVDPDGSVSDVHVVGSSAHIFEKAAMQAVSRSKFKPALKDGQPVASALQRRIDFSLGG